MPPLPVLSLLFIGAFPKISMVTVIIAFPAIVVDDLVIIPSVVIPVITIVNSITYAYAAGTACDKQRQRECCGKNDRSQLFKSKWHRNSSLYIV